MRVHNALGVAGCAAGVTHRGCSAFGNVGPRIRPGRLGLQQLLVLDELARDLDAGRWRTDHDDMANAGNEGEDGEQCGEQKSLADDDLVVGVVDDPGKLLCVQTKVQRVQHRSHRRNGEVRLFMCLDVEHQRRDSVAVVDTKRTERVSQPVGTATQFGEGHRSGRVAIERNHARVAVHG